MEKPNNIISIPCSIDKSFFKYWFKFLKPYHNLTDKEMEVIASFVKYRYQLSKVIKDANILDKVTMSEDTKLKVRGDCNLSSPHFQVIMSKLRKSKIIENNRINPRFIPNLLDESKPFQLLLVFNIK